MQNFIMESPILQEAEIIKSKPNKAIYRMVLQTCDEVNQNKRMYPKKVIVGKKKYNLKFAILGKYGQKIR